MPFQEIVSLLSLLLFLIIQTSVIAYYFGQLTMRSVSLINADNDIKEYISILSKRIDNNNSSYYTTFETKDAVDDKVKALKESVLAFSSQNSEQHSDIKKNSESIKATLEKMNNCLHRLDKAVSNGKQLRPSAEEATEYLG